MARGKKIKKPSYVKTSEDRQEKSKIKLLNLRFIVLFLIIGLNYSGLLAVGQTLAVFNDIEDSTENLFTAGVIDFVLDDKGFDPVEPSISLNVASSTFKNIDILPEPESNPFQYYASSTNFSGDADFCDAIGADALVASSSMYSGALRELLTKATTTLESWNFEFGMGTDNFQNKVCNFDIAYNGWQTRNNILEYGDGGFSDTESASSTISSWGFRLNKIYYDVASDRGEEGGNEWVEIFNQTNVPLDISGWEICDNISCDVISASSSIPAKGFGVITASSTTWGYWHVPSEVVRIVLDDARIGNGLSNGGDALYLKRPDGIVVDEMNWQSNTDVWNPGAVDVAEGNVLTRSPNGYDTDQPSDWIELVPPEVDLIYPDEEGSYTWYWTYSYEIEWTAMNPNGDDADLAIDLYYIKDINGDGQISDGDTKHIIATSTANDGSEWWTVPSGFIGYIWIELVATGSENPMLNTKTISGDIYDPLPIFLWNSDPQAVIDALENPDDEGEGEEIDILPVNTGNGDTDVDAPVVSGENGDGNATTVIDTTAPIITLIGDASVEIEIGADYADEGATATDDTDGDITAQIVTDNQVDTNIEGTYTITYTVTDQAGNVGAAERIVIVIISDGGEDGSIDTPTQDTGGTATSTPETATTTPEVADITAPIMTLLEGESLELYIGDTFTEPGFEAIDDIDGDITASVITGGDIVDTSVVGVYTITYNVSDAAGNSATEVTRTVTVIAPVEEVIEPEPEPQPEADDPPAQEPEPEPEPTTE